jgi:hypothetical protein
MARYNDLAARITALNGEGYPDQAIAERLTADGFRSARQQAVSKELVGKIRRAHGEVAVRQQLRSQDRLGGQWTVHGLARALQVQRTWLYTRIVAGSIPAARHPRTGHYLIPDDPALIEALRRQVPTHRRSQLPRRAVS